MRTILLFTLAIFAVSLSGCQSKTNADAKKETTRKIETQTVPVQDTTHATKASLELIDPILKEAPEYFLVGGCFRIKDNADRMYEALHKEGYTNALIIPYYKYFHLVAYDGYKTREEAVTAMRKLHQIPGKEEIWIYQIK